jgi:hypothetical protein
LIITGKGVNSPNKVSIIKKNFFDWIQTWEMQENLLYIIMLIRNMVVMGHFMVF